MRATDWPTVPKPSSATRAASGDRLSASQATPLPSQARLQACDPSIRLKRTTAPHAVPVAGFLGPRRSSASGSPRHGVGLSPGASALAAVRLRIVRSRRLVSLPVVLTRVIVPAPCSGKAKGPSPGVGDGPCGIAVGCVLVTSPCHGSSRRQRQAADRKEQGDARDAARTHGRSAPVTPAQ